MAANTVWGLDIGNSAIKVVKMVRMEDAVRIVDFDVIDIPGSEDDKDRATHLQSAMSNLIATHRFGNDPVFMAAASDNCLHKEVLLPPGSEAKINELVQFEAKQQIPFPLDQVEWGFERFEDPNGVGVEIIAVRKTDIQEMLNLAETYKFNLRGIAASPMAIFNFIHYEFSPEGTALILDAGAKVTDFIGMNKRQFYFRTIKTAGRDITRVLENKFKVPFDKAEDLKKNIAQSPQADKIFSVIEPTLKQLSSEIQRTIGFYKSKYKGQNVQQCFLLGHTFRLPKMAEYLQTQLRDAPFAIVEGLQRVRLDPMVDPGVWENEFPTMAVAIGLGLQGLGVSELQLNLVPAEKKQADARAGWKKWAAAAAAVIVLSLGWSYAAANSKKNAFESKQHDIDDVLADVKKAQDAAKAAEAGIPELKQSVERLARVGHDRGKILQVFNRIVSLKSVDGRSFFGPDNKVFLSNLYISRAPYTTAQALKPAMKEAGIDPRQKLDTSESLTGHNSLYGYLANGGDPLSAVPELRPDAPLIVVLSAEVENTDRNLALGKIRALEEALNKFDEIPIKADDKEKKEKDIRFERVETQQSAEPKLKYDWKGAIKPPENELNAGADKVPVLAFHAIFRWNDKTNDPDVEMIEKAPEKPKTPAKGGAAPKADAAKTEAAPKE